MPSHPEFFSQITLLNNVKATGSSLYFASGGARGLYALVFSESTSDAVIEFQQAVRRNGKWKTVLTVTNPTSAGSAVVLPPAPFTRANVTTYNSGILTCDIATMDASVTWAALLGTSAQVVGPLTVSSLTNSGLTAGRVPFSGTAGLSGDDSALLFDSATKTLSATILKGGKQSTCTAKATDGAIASAPGTIVITKGSALGSSTLATPTVTTHDGYVLRIVSSTAFAHVISVASGKVNGGANTTITFTSGAVGDSIVLEAYQGVWYTVSKTGTITIT